MPISMFDTRTMLEMLREMPPANTFLKNTFFGNERSFMTEVVDIDIIKGKRRMAPFVSPVIGGKVVERDGFRTETFKPEMLAPKTVTTAEDIMKRAAGETIYGGSTPDERAAIIMGRDMVELDDMITRREEWMCANALFDGKIIMKGEGVDRQIDFGLTNKEALGAGSRWNEDTSDPLADLKGWRRDVIKASGVSPTHVVMGTLAIDAFINNAKVQKVMDLKKVDNGQINPQILPNGVTYYGFIKDCGLDIYGYDEWYIDDEGTEQPMIPEKKVLLASPNARTEMLYGAIIDVEEGTFDLPRVPKSWTTKDPSARFLQLRSRPLPVPVQIDGIYVAQVLA